MIKAVQKVSYNIIWSGHPSLHEELMWYATDDDRVLGVVIRDRVDNDYSWVVLTREGGETFKGVDLAASRPDVATATAELHVAMEAAR
jgi:hypothetical protein